MKNLIVEFEHALKRISQIEEANEDLRLRVHALEETLFGEQPAKLGGIPSLQDTLKHGLPGGVVTRPVDLHLHEWVRRETTTGWRGQCTICGQWAS